jgi:hypothetical protein
MELLILVIGLIVFDLLAWRFGRESRDGFGSSMRDARVARGKSSDEEELARELLAARQRRLGSRRAVAVEGQDGDRLLAPAA